MRSYQFTLTFVLGLTNAVLLSFCGSCEINGCFCSQEYLGCHNLTTFPVQLPKNLEDLHFHDVTFDRIPTDAFRGLTNLKTFKIYRGSVGTIERASFSGFNNLQTVFFDDVSIGEIQDHAFSDLHNLSLTFQSSSIRTIRSNAFKNIRNAQAFVFANLTIERIETHAFENISDVEMILFRMSNITSMASRCFHNFYRIGSFGFHANNVDDLACGNIDSVIPAVTNPIQVYFFKNTISCNCDLAWIINNPALTNVLSFSNLCIIPGTNGHVKISLEDFTLPVMNCTRQDAICPDDELSSTTEVTTHTKQTSPSPAVTSTHMYNVTEATDMASSESTSTILLSSDSFLSKSENVIVSTASVRGETDYMTASTATSSKSTKTTMEPSEYIRNTPSSQSGTDLLSTNPVTTLKSITSTLPSTSTTVPSSVVMETTQAVHSVSRASAMQHQTTSSTKGSQHGGASGATSVTWAVLNLTLNILTCFLVVRTTKYIST
ncbi:leucine-rich repeat-containing G-protein coupled receptor 5-like [Mizuhopecten yessoensis]|uniref:Nyctalopin n=1 Tax=Mizuhopecten yessoensis TaxID=6573 RepID=A0A210PU68_MIZYE|nr:leucine-rich repeat-containing G-protein coupled receptor 5-like [Mizuhopecten yessoensis]OWF39996.1 Nyctalopin [Mizuhopecten yessoensis]